MDEEIFFGVLMFIVFGVPALAFSARFALKPIVEAIIRLREAFVPQAQSAPQERRLAAIEAELTLIRSQLERLEGTAFVKELRSGTEPE